MTLGGMIQLPTFMKIVIGIQALLRLCVSKVRGCNVGIDDGPVCMTYIPRFMKIISGIQKLLRVSAAYIYIDSKMISQAYFTISKVG